MMKKIGIAVAVLIVLGMLFGGDDDAPAPVAASVPQQPAPAPAPEPAPEAEPAEPMSYGDDAELDRLYDLCEADDIDACDELWWDSPIGSEYEAFADKRQQELEPPLSDADLALFALEYTWLNASQSDRDAICDGVAIFGADIAGAMIAAEADIITGADAAAFLADKCK